MENQAAAGDPACTIVIATFNRRDQLLRTLKRLSALREHPPIVVVDNGSSDGTFACVKRAFPHVNVIRLPRNTGAAARNVGARIARTRYIAFCDDDCWWESGSIERASSLLDAHADVALLHARVMVEGASIDEVCTLMASSPISKRTTCPGTAIGAFMACAVVMRRSAFLAAGGYNARYHLGAEESLLALDLLERGWEMIYDPHLVLVHAPEAAGRKPRRRRVAVTRNRLWTVWLRHSAGAARNATFALAREAMRNSEARDALMRAVAGLPWIVRNRRPVHSHVEQLVDQLEQLPA